jgi:plasmid stability protein
MRTLTVRNLPAPLADALEREKRRRGTSLNQTVIDLLTQSLGVHGTRSNGLAAFGGTWTKEEADEFDRAVAFLGEIDEEMWR